MDDAALFSALVSIRQVARRLRIDRGRIDEAIRSGALRAVRLPGAKQVKLRYADVEAWLMASAQAAMANGWFVVGLLYQPKAGGVLELCGTISDPSVVASIQRALEALHSVGRSQLHPHAVIRLASHAPPGSGPAAEPTKPEASTTERPLAAAPCKRGDA